MQMQSTYWLEKVLKMISLYVSALLCMLQHIVIHAMQLSGVDSLSQRQCCIFKHNFMYFQIVPDTDTFKPTVIYVPCRKKGCASSDGCEEKEYCLLQFDSCCLQVLTGCRSFVGVCLLYI